MNKKITGIIIIVVGLFLLIGFIYLIFFGSLFDLKRFMGEEEAPGTAVVNEKESPQKEIASLPADEVPNTKKIIINTGEKEEEKIVERTKENIDKEDLMRMAASFAERYGSYSNQSDFSNIEDLQIFMTKKMAAWTSSYVAEQRAKNADSSIYYGIVTKAIFEEVKSYSEAGGMLVLVKTRRRESIVSPGNSSNVFDQDILIGLVKENGIWKVDSADWRSETSSE